MMFADEEYPEHNKLMAVTEQSQTIGEFLENLGSIGASLASYVPCHRYHADGGSCWRGEHLEPLQQSTESILADYFHIDLTRIEQEKRAMLDAVRREAE